MFLYYLQLGMTSLRRNPVLTVLMVVGIGLGIAASMTTLTVMHLMGSDPIPSKSDKLRYVQLDGWSVDRAYTDDGDPPDQSTYRDAVALMEAARAHRQVAMYKISMTAQPANPEVKPFNALGRATTADFFAMFEVPFAWGGGWDRQQDAQHGRVVVLDKATNERLFGGADSIGKTVRLGDVDYTVSGVLAEWQPRIKFYDLTNGTLDQPEAFYIPLATAVELEAGSAGNNNCWKESGEGWQAYLDSECVWLQMWVELESSADVAAYQSFIDTYVGEQKKLGRFQRPLNNRLPDVNQWMENQRVVSSDMEVQTGLAFAFLAVCLLNTVGLLLAKFMRKSGEIGLRRALGASRGQVFAQHLVEAAVVGISGGIVGLLLTGGGLAIVRSLYDDFSSVARLDWMMVAATIVLAIIASLLAGLYPTWRACRIVPAVQLKTQ